MDIWPWLKQKKYFLILACLSAFMLFVYLWLFSGADQVKFTSPDETANYHFIKLFAEKSQLRFAEPLNELADGLVRPRSMGYADGYTVPGSFLGIILIYGLIAKIFGSGVIIYLTPIFAAVGVVFFYLLLKNFFSRQTAVISAALCLLLPPYWYYASRGMFHNILFVCLLMIGFYFLARAFAAAARRPWLLHLAAGFFISLALLVRTNEIIWVALILAVVFFVRREKLSPVNSAVFLGPLIIMFFIIFTINNIIYGSPFSFAYSQEAVSIDSWQSASGTFFAKLKNLVWPFAFDFGQIGRAAYRYLIVIFPWYSLGLLAGLVWLVKSAAAEKISAIFPEVKKHAGRLSPPQKLYLFLYLLMSLWLVLYYGSFVFSEYADPTEIILGSSYLRYWLPVFVFGLPILVTAISRLSRLFFRRLTAKIVLWSLVLFFCVLSVNQTLADPLQGIWSLKNHLADYRQMSRLASETTAPGAVIISGHADKVFFPEQRVVVSLPADMDRAKKMVKDILIEAPLYYFYNPLSGAAGAEMDYLQAGGFIFSEAGRFAKDGQVLYRLQ